MIRNLLILSLMACVSSAQAQGTFRFNVTLTGTNEAPPNNDPTVAIGAFTLDGNLLSFYVDVPAVTFIVRSAYIQGPALPGTNGPVIFDLGGPVFRPGNDFGTPPVYRFFSPFEGTFGAGPFTLSAQQINDLENGLWYVNATTDSLPNGQLRGQLLLEVQATLRDPLVTNNLFQFTVSQVNGLNYIIQASTDLGSTNWVSIVTNTAPFTFSDTGFTNCPQRLYRALYKN